jgi:hypothetical protein
MIEIKPELKLSFECPECNCKDITVSTLVFPGIRMLADCTCFCCENNFLADLPVGHALYYPKALLKKTGKVYPGEKKMNWFSRQLWESYHNKALQHPVSVEKISFQEAGKEVVLLNCLDYLYGHVLLKLFNAEAYLKSKSESSLILILPKSFEWLVPQGVTEIWLVDLSLANLKKWHDDIDKFIHHELQRFQKVYLSPAYSHPDLSHLDIALFTKIQPFNIQNFTAESPVVTFIYREDRLWHSQSWEEYIFLISGKFRFLRFVKGWFLFLQNRKIISFLKKLKKNIPQAKCILVGLGQSGRFPHFVEDKRTNKLDADKEEAWCQIYAASHLVVGIHGSNMLLPTAHAAGFLEILPDSRIGNMTQDIIPRLQSKYLLFMGRHVSSSLSPVQVAKHAVAMIKGFPAFELYNSSKYLRYEIINNAGEYHKLYRLHSGLK